MGHYIRRRPDPQPRPRALEHKADFVSGLGHIKPLRQLCQALVYLNSNSALALGAGKPQTRKWPRKNNVRRSRDDQWKPSGLRGYCERRGPDPLFPTKRRIFPRSGEMRASRLRR